MMQHREQHNVQQQESTGQQQISNEDIKYQVITGNNNTTVQFPHQ